MSIPADQMEQFTGRPPQPQPMPAGAVAQVAPAMPVVPAGTAPQAAPVAPSPTPAPDAPYSFGAGTQDFARRTFPAAYRDYEVQQPTPPEAGAAGGAGGGAGGQGSQGGMPKYPEVVMNAEKQKGGKLTVDELEALSTAYRTNVVQLGNLSKGFKDYQIKGALEVFDTNTEAFHAWYLSQAEQAAATQGADPYGNTQLGELAAAATAGVGKVGTGIVSLVDLAYRASPLGLLEAQLTGRVGPTPLGEWAGEQSQRIGEAADSFRTLETEQQDTAYAANIARLGDDASYMDYIDAVASSGGRRLLRQGTDVVAGMALPGLGMGTKVARTAIGQLPKGLQRITRAAGIGGPQSGAATARWQADAEDMALAEFSPEVQKAAADMVEAGVPREQAELMAKRTAIQQALPVIAATNLAMDVGLAALPIFGKAEELVSRGGKAGNVLTRIPASAAEEAVEEGIAGAGSQVAENVAARMTSGRPVPLSRGVKAASAEGSVLGAIAGGGVAAIPQPSAPKPVAENESEETPAPEATPTPEATGGTAPTATPTPPATSVFANGAGIEPQAAEGVNLKISEKIGASLVSPRGKERVKGYSPEQVVAAATDIAQTTAGEAWAGMSAIQKVDAVEAAVTALKKVNKTNTTALTTAIREQANQIMTPPTAPVVETPLPADITAPPTATPTAAPKSKAKPLAAKPVPAPPAAAPAAPSATAPTDKTWATMNGGERLTTVQEALAKHNAANPQAPLGIGAVTVAINSAPEESLNGLTADTLATALPALVKPAAKPTVPAPPAATVPPKKAAKPLAKAKPAAAPQAPATPPAAKVGTDIAKAQEKAANEAAKKAETAKPLKETTVDAVRRIVTDKPVEVTSDIVDAVNTSKKAKTADAVDAAIAKHKLPKAQADAVRALAGIKGDTKPLAKKAVPAPPPDKKPLAKKSVPAPPATAKLPDELAKGAPNYAYGTKQFTLAFDNDVDKAIYIVSGKGKSKSHQKFMDWLEGQGITEADIAAGGQRIRDAIKAKAKDQKPLTTIRVPNMGGTQSPKTNAPAGAGAAVATTPNVPTPTPAQAAALPAPTPPAGENYVEATKRIVGDSLSAGQRVDMIRAVRRSRDAGTLDILNAEIESLQGEAEIELTPDQIRDLRMLVTPQAARAPTVQGTLPDEPTSANEQESDIQELRDAIQKAIAGKHYSLQAKLALEVVAKSPYATKHQKWLARKLAPVLGKARVSLVMGAVNPLAHGRYTISSNNVEIFTARPSTILHEALHALTVHAMNGRLPNSRLIEARWDNLFAHIKKHVKDNGLPDTLSGYAKERLKAALGKKEELLTYAMTSPEARTYFATLPATSDAKVSNLWDEFKSLLVDFYAKIFNATLPQRSFLDQLIEMTAATVENTDNFVSRGGLLAVAATTNVSSELMDAKGAGPTTPSSKTAKVLITPVTAAQKLWEVFAFASLGIEKSMQDVLRNGGKILAEYNPYYAYRKFTADMAELKATDTLEVVEPLKNWLAENWRSFGSISALEFRKDLDKFLQAHHMLTERNPTIWAETVELSPSAELERDKLIDDAYAGVIDGPTLNTRLLSLANRFAKTKLDAWSDTTKFAKSNAALRKTLADLKKKGFDTKSLAELNKYMQGIRDRARERQYASGVISQTDPFAHRGWEWYVPLKGHLSVSETMADYDIGATRGSTTLLRKSNKQLLRGRQSTAGNAMTQLIEDMYSAASDAAKGEFTAKLFEYSILVPKNKEILRAKYTKYYGTPKSGYYAMVKKVDKKTGAVTYVKGRTHAVLKPPSYGFIHHNGDEHYVVYLPKDSQLHRGVSGMDRIATPINIPAIGGGVKAVGIGTNILARAYTTWHPVWQLMVGFLRDTTTLPTTVAMTVFDSPTQATGFAGSYVKRLAANTAQLHDLPRVWQSIRGNKAKLKEYIQNNPDSLFAKIAAYRAAGGSTEFEQGMNQEIAEDYLFGGLEPTAGKRALDVYEGWNAATSNWAALLENVGRVSAWEALVAGGMSPEEAAAISKSALDYNQSGEWGRVINAFHAFFRVSATSADVIRRAFTTKTGEIDLPKLAKWSPTFIAMGSVAYILMGMMLGDDEDGKPRISKMDAKTLTQRFVFPGTDGDTNSFPIGLGLPQIMLTPGILGTAVTMGHISPEEATEAYYDVLRRSSPVSPMGQKKGTGPLGFASAWAMGMLTPTVIRPGIEVNNNTNAFGNTVHTEWVDSKKFKSDQGMPSTGQEWKDIAGFLKDTTTIDMYPEDWAQLARGYGGQVATEIVRWTIDKERKELEGVESSAIRTSLRLSVTDEDFYYRNEARAAKDELTTSLRELNSAKEDGMSEARWLSQNPQHRVRINELKALEKAQDTYYAEIAKIRDNKLLAVEGRRLQKKRADSRLRQAVERAQRVIGRTQ